MSDTQTDMPGRASGTEIVSWKYSVDTISVNTVTNEVDLLKVSNERDTKRTVVLTCVDHSDTSDQIGVIEPM